MAPPIYLGDSNGSHKNIKNCPFLLKKIESCFSAQNCCNFEKSFLFSTVPGRSDISNHQLTMRLENPKENEVF